MGTALSKRTRSSLSQGFRPPGVSPRAAEWNTDPTVTGAFRVNSEKRQEPPRLGVQDVAAFSEPGGCEGFWK